MAENKETKRFMPKTFIEWLTVVTLVVGIGASIFGAIARPYLAVGNLERRITTIESKIDSISEDVRWIKAKVFR